MGDSEEVIRKRLTERIRDHVAGYNDKDWHKMSLIYTEDCWAVNPGHEPVRGRHGVCTRGVFDAIHAAGGVHLEMTLFEINISGDMSATMCGYVLHKSDGTFFDRGSVLTTWKKIEGDWYMHFDMVTSSVSI